MKKIAIAAGALVAIFAASCSGSSDNIKTVSKAADSTAAVCNIRYVDFDSVFVAYTLAQELTAEQQKEMLDVESKSRQKGYELQNLQASIQKKYNSNGYLTEESLKADMNSLQQRQDDAERWAATQQERLARMAASHQQRLMDSLENFIRDYNAVYGYDAILNKSAGFFKPELDITADIIQGLNARYTPEGEKK